MNKESIVLLQDTEVRLFQLQNSFIFFFPMAKSFRLSTYYATISLFCTDKIRANRSSVSVTKNLKPQMSSSQRSRGLFCWRAHHKIAFYFCAKTNVFLFNDFHLRTVLWSHAKVKCLTRVFVAYLKRQKVGVFHCPVPQAKS